MKPFFGWFEQDMLGLDSEEYRHAFWREANRTGRPAGYDDGGRRINDSNLRHKS